MRTRLLVLGAAGSLAWFGWQAWLWWLRNEPLDQAARKIVAAALAGDGGPVHSYSHLREREQLGLGPAEYRRFVRDYARPVLANTRRGVELVEWDDGKRALHYTLMLTNAAGVEVPFTLSISRTPNGPRGYLAGDIALATAVAKHARPDGSRPLDYFAVAEQAIRIEASELQKQGVHSLLSGGPNARPIPWVQMADYWKAELDRRARSRAP
ncbi:MAG: hypothetical protein IT207_03500 [Fimbriimonadaceae bacterium]|nr:hypothetical protein [Fimbriimonadaceae bacterium]